jgi:hypothetical protein
LWAKLCFDFVAIVSNGNLPPTRIGLAREAVIRLLTDQPEVTQELVVTASAEFGISRSLVYRLVAKFRTAAAGFANKAVSWYWRFLLMIILARQLNSRESGLSTI